MQAKKALNILAWALIAVLFVATAIWTEWGSHQPRTHSIWAPGGESLP
jgi:hypothetical protein